MRNLPYCDKFRFSKIDLTSPKGPQNIGEYDSNYRFDYDLHHIISISTAKRRWHGPINVRRNATCIFKCTLPNKAVKRFFIVTSGSVHLGVHVAVF